MKFRIITHDGTFHLDEAFAIATLKIFLKKENKKSFFKPKFKIIRTRDLSVVKKGDYVIDIGGENDSEKLFFDHHQIGGAGERKNGIPYASFGLIWKEYGEIICGSKEVSKRIDKKLVQSIDALDNGVDLYELKNPSVAPYLFFDLGVTYNFLSKYNGNKPEKSFLKIVDLAEEVLLKEIQRAVIQENQRKKVLEIYNKTEDKRLMIFNEDYDDFVIDNTLIRFKEPIFVIKPNSGKGDQWKIKAIRISLDSFEARKDLPLVWAGKRDKELQEVTGVSDAIFCHNKRFIAVAGSKEGIIDLARLALQEA